MFRSILFSSLVAATLLPACSTTPTSDELAGESSADGEPGKNDQGASAFTFFTVSPDLRACAPSATCGGWYVSRVNRSRTTCGDGTSAEKCFVSSFDWSHTAMPTSVAKSYQDRLFSGEPLLLRGNIDAASDDHGPALAVTEIWVPGSDTGVAEGVFVLAKDNGVRCIMAPCNSITETRLNSTRSAMISAVDLEPAGASSERTDRAYEALHHEGLIVVGDRFYPDRSIGRTANQFYTKAPVPLF